MPKVTQYNKGSIIYFEGDKDERIFILQKGHVILSKVDINTKSSTTTLLNPGEFFGIKSALGQCLREETVMAADNAVCVVLTIAEFEKYFSSNKQLIIKMLRIFSKELKLVHAKTTEILNKDSKKENDEDESIDMTDVMEDGFLSVATSFFEDEKWTSCIDICTRLLKKNSIYAKNPDVVNMIKISNANAVADRKREEKEIARLKSTGEYSEYGNNGLDSDFKSENTDKAFNLPSFERFAKIYKNGEIIIAEFEKGETFYLIQRGLVQLTKCVNGKNKNLDILKPGELFGEMAILDNSPRSATCVAKGRVECLEFNKENFELLITGTPQIALRLLNLFCKRILDQTRRFKILMIDDPAGKIADVFCMFNETQTLPPVLDIPEALASKKQTIGTVDKREFFSLSVNDVAHWAGISIEKTRDEMGKMAKNGFFQIFDNFIVVNNMADLRRFAENKIKIMNMKANPSTKGRTDIKKTTYKE